MLDCQNVDPMISIVDRSDATFTSVNLLELFSLSYITDWINVSFCVASGATIAFILLLTSLDHNFRSSSWDCTLSSPSLAVSTEACALATSTICRVGALLHSDIMVFSRSAERKVLISWFSEIN